MALEKEECLVTLDIVRYHRVAKISTNGPGEPATAILESFRSRKQRELPIQPVTRREYVFIWSGLSDSLINEAYQSIKDLPEWGSAIDC